MKCEVAERELSARLDGGGDARLDGELSAHLATCHRCRAFAGGADRVRTLVRLEPAAEVPDLVPRIMAAVREEADRRRAPVVIRLPRISAPAWRRYAVAFAVGAVLAALVAGGLPFIRTGPGPALAEAIPQEVAAASTEVAAYRAVFEVVERNFHEFVPEREFVARVTFRAPERFRAVVEDVTRYPSDAWPRNDLVLAVDRDRWRLEGPRTCPRQGLPACAMVGAEVRAVRGREPFDGDAPLPTDIVLPVRTLAGSSRVQVVGEGDVLGRPVVIVGLTARDAQPLLAFVQAAGVWRPFFPTDRVLVSLDRETWFPLAYEIFPAESVERAAWAGRNGLPTESPDQAIFRAEALSFQARAPAAFRPIPGPLTAPRDEGFRDAGFGEVAQVVGHEPVVPSDLGGLTPYRAGFFELGGRPVDEVLLSYTEGLAWLKIRETKTWSEPALFGDVGVLAASISLPGGGLAYYEPASAMLGRRLSIHASGWDIYLESNLPQSRLFEIAGSLPVRGEAVPEEWRVREWPGGVVREQVSLEQAVAAAPYLLLPFELPTDYRFWTAHVVQAGGQEGVTVFFRRPGAEFDGVGIRFHQAPGTGLPPPVEAEVLAVRVRGMVGRYSPFRGELEWVERDVYRSIRAPGLDLASLLELARSLEPGDLQVDPR